MKKEAEPLVEFPFTGVDEDGNCLITENDMSEQERRVGEKDRRVMPSVARPRMGLPDRRQSQPHTKTE